MTADVHGSVQRQYLDGLRAALADLPAPEVGEILDDVGAHLAEVGAELGPDADLAAFSARLGSPQAYAAELRSAAGYPSASAPTPAPGSGGAWLAVVGLVGATAATTLTGLWLFLGVGFGALWIAVVAGLLAVPALVSGGPRVGSVAALPVVQRFVAARPAPDSAGGRCAAFVASLQPAWWLLRAFVAAMLVGLFLGRGGSFEGTVVALTLVFAAISVWLGFRSRVDRRWLWLVVPLNAFAAALVLTGWPGWASAAGYVTYPETGYAAAVPYSPGLWQDGERRIEDIRPVDAAGVPLSGVYLFDQDGRPIDTGDDEYCTGYSGSSPSADPVRPYPRGTVGYDDRTGECVVVPPGPLVVAVPSAVPTTIAPTTIEPTVQAPPTG